MNRTVCSNVLADVNCARNAPAVFANERSHFALNLRFITETRHVGLNDGPSHTSLAQTYISNCRGIRTANTVYKVKLHRDRAVTFGRSSPSPSSPKAP